MLRQTWAQVPSPVEASEARQIVLRPLVRAEKKEPLLAERLMGAEIEMEVGDEESHKQ